MSKTARIFDIQSFSVHDGPGCRTTVFMSGCPLKCRWCANPESWNKDALMFSELTCRYKTGCSLCKDKCLRNALTFNENNKPVLNLEECRNCDDYSCAKACYYDALKNCSQKYSQDDLMKVLERDFNNWRSNGGVTFSGGEPLMQSEFLIETLKECKSKNFHTAIETSAYAKEEVFLEAMSYIDFAFIDLKHMDREKHKEKTGVYNDLIKSNIAKLASSSWKGRLVLRTPVIDGFNDDIENMKAMMEFMKSNDLVEINLLPFHRFGESKWNQLGNNYDYSSCGDVNIERLGLFQDMFLENSIACYIGDETTF